jgi:hypothetical protein
MVEEAIIIIMLQAIRELYDAMFSTEYLDRRIARVGMRPVFDSHRP